MIVEKIEKRKRKRAQRIRALFRDYFDEKFKS